LDGHGQGHQDEETTMSHKQLFWLHIKKSAGITTRTLLQPYYVEVDRVKKPINFIQAKPEEYNDVLNNYRVVLGEYQFRRCLFAKQYLYPDSWDDLFSFAFSREPTDRCISMFYYMFWKHKGPLESLLRACRNAIRERRITSNLSYAFDVFLDYAEQARTSPSIYEPLGLHFTTHTAPMWEDITDRNGMILLKGVFRLENLIDGINKAFEECGIEKRHEQSNVVLNRNKKRKSFTPNSKQLQKIERIYFEDFELYENAWR
jgi:hypothetical protein